MAYRGQEGYGEYEESVDGFGVSWYVCGFVNDGERGTTGYCESAKADVWIRGIHESVHVEITECFT